MAKRAKKSPTQVDQEAEGLSMAELLGAEVNKVLPGAAGTYQDLPSNIKGYVHTGMLPLDLHLAECRFRGGLPLGRVVELFGPEGAGKTTLATQVMVAAQQGRCTQVDWALEDGVFVPSLVCRESPPGVAVLVDLEDTYNLPRAQQMGLDLDRFLPLYVGEAPAVEDIFEATGKILKTAAKMREDPAAPIVVVVDSIAVSESRSDQSRVEAGKPRKPGDRAAMISAGFKRLKRVLSRHRGVFLVLNQVVDMIGPISGQTTPAGKALRHAATLRIKVTKRAIKRSGERPIGILMELMLVKSNICQPHHRFFFPLHFAQGVLDDRATAEWVVDKSHRDLWATSKKSTKPKIPITAVHGGYCLTSSKKKAQAKNWSSLLDKTEGAREEIEKSVAKAMRLFLERGS